MGWHIHLLTVLKTIIFPDNLIDMLLYEIKKILHQLVWYLLTLQKDK